MSYKSQLEFKQSSVEKLIKQYNKVNDILGMKEPYFYRNKVNSRVAYDGKRKIISGIYEEKTHNVISIDKCIIQDKHADDIIASILEMMKAFKMKPYEEDTGRGFLRHILVKRGFASNEIMVVLIVSSQVFPSKNNFINTLLKKHPEITTIVMNVNNRKTSVVLGNTEKVILKILYVAAYLKFHQSPFIKSTLNKRKSYIIKP